MFFVTLLLNQILSWVTAPRTARSIADNTPSGRSRPTRAGSIPPSSTVSKARDPISRPPLAANSRLRGEPRRKDHAMTTTTTDAPTFDPAALEAFTGLVGTQATAAMNGLLVALGDQLGLWKALAGAGPVTPAELSGAPGSTSVSFANGWPAQAANGLLDCDPQAATFTLSDEAAMVLADEDSPRSMIAAFQGLVPVAAQHCRARAGVPHRRRPGVAGPRPGDVGRAGAVRPATAACIPHRRVARRGAGSVGHASKRASPSRTSVAATAARRFCSRSGFPHPASSGSTSTTTRSCKRAMRLDVPASARRGLVRGRAGADSFPGDGGDGYDVVLFIDCLHDMGDPVAAVRHARACSQPAVSSSRSTPRHTTRSPRTSPIPSWRRCTSCRRFCARRRRSRNTVRMPSVLSAAKRPCAACSRRRVHDRRTRRRRGPVQHGPRGHGLRDHSACRRRWPSSWRTSTPLAKPTRPQRRRHRAGVGRCRHRTDRDAEPGAQRGDHADVRSRARAAAAAGGTDEPFAGVPMLLKDLAIETPGVAFSEGSRFLDGYVSPLRVRARRPLPPRRSRLARQDEHARVRDGAGVRAGAFGPTRNPWDTRHARRRGSSGGSAAAVAAGLGADGARQRPRRLDPLSRHRRAALFGLKPTRARNPLGPRVRRRRERRGVRARADPIGARQRRAPRRHRRARSRAIRTAAPPPARPFVRRGRGDPGRLRIAFSPLTPDGTPGHPDCLAALDDAARAARAARTRRDRGRLHRPHAGGAAPRSTR